MEVNKNIILWLAWRWRCWVVSISFFFVTTLLMLVYCCSHCCGHSVLAGPVLKILWGPDKASHIFLESTQGLHCGNAAYPLPKVISGKGPRICLVSGSLISTGSFSSRWALVELEECLIVGEFGCVKSCWRNWWHTKLYRASRWEMMFWSPILLIKDPLDVSEGPFHYRLSSWIVRDACAVFDAPFVQEVLKLFRCVCQTAVCPKCLWHS